MKRHGGTLKIQEEGRNASDNEGDITEHQDEFENYPPKMHVWGLIKNEHNKDNLLIEFVNIIGLKEEKWKG